MKREKSKWLVALVLCVTCLALCVSMLAVPTLANPDTPGDPDYTGTETIVNTGSGASTESGTGSNTESNTVSNTASNTASNTVSNTASNTASNTVSNTASNTVTASIPSTLTAESQTSNVSGSTEKRMCKATATKGVFEVVGADGSSKNPKEFIYSATNNPEIGTVSAAYQKGDKYYVAYPSYSNIYQLVLPDGSLSLTGGFWSGADKVFGNADDKEINGIDVKFENGFFWLKSLAGDMWELIANEINNGSTNTATSTNSASASNSVSSSLSGSTVSGSTVSGSTLSTSPFFSGDDESDFPDTGRAVNTGITVCIAILAMGTIYCAYRFFRKDETSAYTVA